MLISKCYLLADFGRLGLLPPSVAPAPPRSPCPIEPQLHHLVGHRIKSRSSHPGCGDPAKDAGLPVPLSLSAQVSPANWDLGSCMPVPRATWPARSTPHTSANTGRLSLATPLILPVALPGSLHLLRLRLQNCSLLLLVWGDVQLFLGKAMSVSNPGSRKEYKTALTNGAKHGSGVFTLSCFSAFGKPGVQVQSSPFVWEFAFWAVS